MEFDLHGKLRRISLPKSKVLAPLQEAIANSVHATMNSGIPRGYIKIHILRNTSQTSTEDKANSEYPVKGFKVEDNGVGFTDENFSSFQKANSTHKIEFGGMGVGRFLYLKVFRDVKVKSIYKNSTKSYVRQFDFRVTDSGVENETKEERTLEKNKTEVLLDNMVPTYAGACPKSLGELCDRLFLHNMGYLILEDCPTIEIIDGPKEKRIVLNDLYNKNLELVSEEPFKIRKLKFKVSTYKILNLTSKHTIHYCAHSREVEEKPLSKEIPELNRQLKNGDVPFYLKAFVSGEYLDECVNEERTGFNFPTKGPLDFEDEAPFEEIQRSLLISLNKSIGPLLAEARSEKMNKIRMYVDKRAPQFRVLFKYKKDRLEKLPVLSDEKLDIELYQILHELEMEIKKEGRKVFKGLNNKEDVQDFKSIYSDYFEKLKDVGNTSLTKYIVHRKAVLKLLETTMNKRDDDKFSKEDAVHKLIFPLRTSSDDINYEDHNLWLIDERLSYHTYLASEKPLSGLPKTEINTNKRPDLVSFNDYFDNAYALSETPNGGFPSVVIIEFKKPMRNDYAEGEEKNPIEQVLTYVKEIREDKKKLKTGRQFNAKSIPFYCYIICDITSKLKDRAKLASLTETPDGKGYFGYNSNFGAYIEIISYDKMIDDSKKRNRILFDKLKLPMD